jgi:hypothetical protein
VSGLAKGDLPADDPFWAVCYSPLSFVFPLTKRKITVWLMPVRSHTLRCLNPFSCRAFFRSSLIAAKSLHIFMVAFYLITNGKATNNFFINMTIKTKKGIA